MLKVKLEKMNRISRFNLNGLQKHFISVEWKQERIKVWGEETIPSVRQFSMEKMEGLGILRVNAHVVTSSRWYHFFDETDISIIIKMWETRS